MVGTNPGPGTTFGDMTADLQAKVDAIRAGWPRPERHRPLVIGMAGGSGSGKTTIAESVVEQIGPDRVAFIPHDAYYRHRPDLTFEQRTKVNYDHPESLETAFMVEQVEALLAGDTVARPVYDFSNHLRSDDTVEVEPRPVLMLEGILILVEPALVDLMDLKIYVDTDADLRLMRRLERDVQERGRTLASVLRQYETTVRPMHLQFVEPSKRYADIIIPEGYNLGAVGTVISMIRDVVRRDTA